MYKFYLIGFCLQPMTIAVSFFRSTVIKHQMKQIHITCIYTSFRKRHTPLSALVCSGQGNHLCTWKKYFQDVVKFLRHVDVTTDPKFLLSGNIFHSSPNHYSKQDKGPWSCTLLQAEKRRLYHNSLL